MYHNTKLNALIIAASVLGGVAMFMFIRQQTAVRRPVLRSMIPHHSGAILMCEGASLQDRENRELCKAIVASQRRELDRMVAKLRALER